MAIFVFDVRGKVNCSVSAHVHRITDETKLKEVISERYNVPQECVLTGVENNRRIAIITDRKCLKTNIFMVFFADNNHAFDPSFSCISVDNEMSVETLIKTVQPKQEEEDLQMDYIFLQKRIFKRSTQRLSKIEGLNRIVMCKFIKQRSLKLKCHYHSKPDVEILYHLQCFNTDTVQELKLKFERQFGKEFPSILNKSQKVWLSCGTRILNNDEHVLFESETNIHGFDVLFPLNHVTVHVSSKYSIACVVSFTGIEKHSGDQKMIVIEGKKSTDDLRYEIGKHFNQEPNSLKLKLKKKKIPESTLLEKLDAFIPNCHIFVELSRKKTYTIKVFKDGETSARSRRTAEMYKHDKVSMLKDMLASSEGIHPFLVELYYSGAQMVEESVLKAYCIGSGDGIDMIVYANRIKLHIRCPGHKARCVVIDDASTITLLDVKRYLSEIYQMHSSEMNAIFNGKSLNNFQTLNEANIKCSCTLVVCKLSPCGRWKHDEIVLLYYMDQAGVAQSRKCVVFVGGERFTKDDDPEMDTATDLTQQTRRQEVVPKGIRPFKITQNEGVSVYSEQGVGPGQTKCSLRSDVVSPSVKDVSTQVERTLQRVTTGPTYESPSLMQGSVESENTLQSGSLGPTYESSSVMQGSAHCLTLPKDTLGAESESKNSTLPLRRESGSQQGDSWVAECTSLLDSNSHTTTAVTASPTMVNTLPIPSTAVAIQSTYQKQILRNTDGIPIQIESHSCHKMLNNDELMTQLSKPSCEQQLFPTPCTPQMQLQIAPPKAEVDKLITLVSFVLGNEWQPLALQLELEKNDIERCECRYPKDLGMQAHTMLTRWSQKKGKLATKELLIHGLKMSGLNSIAETLEEFNSVI